MFKNKIQFLPSKILPMGGETSSPLHPVTVSSFFKAHVKSVASVAFPDPCLSVQSLWLLGALSIPSVLNELFCMPLPLDDELLGRDPVLCISAPPRALSTVLCIKQAQQQLAESEERWDSNLNLRPPGRRHKIKTQMLNWIMRQGKTVSQATQKEAFRRCRESVV